MSHLHPSRKTIISPRRPLGRAGNRRPVLTTAIKASVIAVVHMANNRSHNRALFDRTRTFLSLYHSSKKEMPPQKNLFTSVFRTISIPDLLPNHIVVDISGFSDGFRAFEKVWRSKAQQVQQPRKSVSLVGMKTFDRPASGAARPANSSNHGFENFGQSDLWTSNALA
jgi:hypothetical protein